MEESSFKPQVLLTAYPSNPSVYVQLNGSDATERTLSRWSTEVAIVALDGASPGDEASITIGLSGQARRAPVAPVTAVVPSKSTAATSARCGLTQSALILMAARAKPGAPRVVIGVCHRWDLLNPVCRG